ncbi:molybdopterin-dependent oxidoreductase [Sulfitobacter sp. PR48]|nr:molybdopterin-dependent oxidoreductase [Sulfitobacter sp. PR48]MDD9721893.1 molybdopterin-dependent oxidoreductase [Sulfitobacter sp. PR48]
MNKATPKSHSSHWGAFTANFDGDALVVQPFKDDPDPSPILKNIPSALAHPSRLSKPLVRKGWLNDGPGPDDRRGRDTYVEMEWDAALDLAAAELSRLGGGTAGQKPRGEVPGKHVFGGSYGWSSAGRFHHAQSQVHRFLNMAFGGYVASVDTYSTAAGSVILDTVVGNATRITREGNWWEHIRDRTELVIAFGGLPLRNLSVSPGGSSQHIARDSIQQGLARGCHFVSVSPLDDDFSAAGNATRIRPRPGTDTALMLGMAHHLHVTGQTDEAYLARYTSGWDVLRDYLEGRTDDIVKSPEWAEGICGVTAGEIRHLADEAAGKRTLITVAYGLQRAENGEQPVWMALALSAMLGRADQQGAGFTYALGSMGNHGKPPLAVPVPTLPQGRNRSGDFIPVSRISDLLLNPGTTYTYRGEERRYAEINLVYWAGGNPFHHHQDLAKLSEAFTRPDTIILHESVGTATTAHADIIFPATITAEREDIGASAGDPYLVPMERLTAPFGEARDDYDIFCALAQRLGCLDLFTEGRSSRGWLEHIYAKTERAMKNRGESAPNFADFMTGGPLKLPVSKTPGMMEAFHRNPETNALTTDSGLIELYSEKVAASGLPGHPAWIEPREWLGGTGAEARPFQLIANQPIGKLHSQLDFGPTSMSHKVDGREVARLNDRDANRLGIAQGDVVKIWNDRGATLAVASPDPGVASGVIQLSTGAWYAPRHLEGHGLVCLNGNPNAVTSDRGASPFSQGCSGQTALVSVSRIEGPVPAVVPHKEILPREDGTEDQLRSEIIDPRGVPLDL